jgi:hypothetical protein
MQMNDAAAATLGVFAGLGNVAPPGGLAPGLRELAAGGIVMRDDVLTFTGHGGWAPEPPGAFPDLTGWECFVSSFHLEDLVPVHVDVPEGGGQPFINEEDQRVLLLHGVAFALQICRLVPALDPPVPVRCIVGANDTNATFRFHRIRTGEQWIGADLDSYQRDKLVVVDAQPSRRQAHR